MSVIPLVEKPVLEVEGGPARVGLATLRELWVFREVLAAFALRRVQVRYKQAALGAGWAIVQPLAVAGLLAVVLGRFANVPSDGAPYFLFALAGMVAWSYVVGAASAAAESVVADQVLVRKVYFPREILPLAAVAAAFVDLVPALTVLLAVAAAYGVAPSLAWLLLPVPVLLLATFAAAIGIGFSGLNVYYRDVRHLLPFAFQLGLFASPVIYPVSAVPEAWRTLYVVSNPAAAAIDGLRRIVLEGAAPEAATTAAALAWALLLGAVGYTIFKRLERGFSDRV